MSSAHAPAAGFRPIVLTAAALVAGGIVILLDPIFQGLAVSLISGVVVSTALTLVVIPLLYFMYVSTAGVEAVVRRDTKGDAALLPGEEESPSRKPALRSVTA